ncbi:MAG TPA: hypothetical protein V6D14_16475 [Coleofasciculaceae cyanobacterium]
MKVCDRWRGGVERVRSLSGVGSGEGSDRTPLRALLKAIAFSLF